MSLQLTDTATRQLNEALNELMPTQVNVAPEQVAELRTTIGQWLDRTCAELITQWSAEQDGVRIARYYDEVVITVDSPASQGCGELVLHPADWESLRTLIAGVASRQ